MLSVRLNGFGALQGRFKLDPKLTIVGGPNESGKSTLHTAIRMALCGVELPARGRMPKESEEVLRHFRPWTGKQFAVEAEIELAGSRYRIVRDLDQPDNCQVFDLVKGGDVTDRFRRGRHVDVAAAMGMSRAAFLAVSTVGQDQLLHLEGTALQEDLQRATATSGSDSTASAAIALLQSWRQEHIRGERTRQKPLDKLTQELKEARERRDLALSGRQEVAQEMARQAELGRELATLEAEVQSKEQAWKTAELDELDQDLGAIAELDRQLAEVPEPKLPKDPTALREAATGARGLAQQLRQAEAKAAELPGAAPELGRLAQQSSPQELNFLISALDQVPPEVPSHADEMGRLDLLDHRRVAMYRWGSNLLALAGGVLGVLLILRGIGLIRIPSGSANVVYVVAGLVVIVVAGTVFLALQGQLRRLLAVGGLTSVAQMRQAARARDPETERILGEREKILAEQGQAGKRLAELGLGGSGPDRLRQLAQGLPEVQASEQQRSSLEGMAQRFRAELLSRAKRVGISGVDPDQVAEELGTRLKQLDQATDATRTRAELAARRADRLGGRDLKALNRRAEELRAELGQLPEGPEGRGAGQTSGQLREGYDATRTRAEGIRSELLPLAERLAQRLAALGEVAELEERVAELEQDEERLTRAEEAIKLAIGELQHAEGLIHNDLAPVLAEGVSQRLPLITGKRYLRAWVDPSNLAMHVAPRESGRQLAVSDLSQGTREQIYVCLRMVLAGALSPDKEPIPLFFDDPCVSSDDHRATALLDTLLELASTSQVVVFSHESRVGSWAKRKEVPVLTLTAVPAFVDEPTESEASGA
ncbi:MAG: AAA family ATPase [Candidatus Dormibacteria bacterium]